MKNILLFIVFLQINFIQTSDECSLSSFLIQLESTESKADQKIRRLIHKITEEAMYIGAGTVLGSASLLAKLGWASCLMTPWPSSMGKEFYLLSHLCSSAAHHAFAQAFKGGAPSSRGVFPSQRSWFTNQKLLSHIPATSDEEKQLLVFLENRWLAKVTGFFHSAVNWVCPCFGVAIQVHPQTTSTYARNPWNEFSQVYKNRVKEWKHILPHPEYYPLILTRPNDLRDYLPKCLSVAKEESVQTTVERAALEIKSPDSKILIDLTEILFDIKDQEQWIQNWEKYREAFSQTCKAHYLDQNQILCIQKVQQKEIGGIRLLPLADQDMDSEHVFLLEWISTFGLTANRVELDRLIFPSNFPVLKERISPISLQLQSKEQFTSYLDSFEQNWKSTSPQKTLMLKGTLQVLKGLLVSLSQGKWNEIAKCPTKGSIAQLSFLKIKEELNYLAQEGERIPFFDLVSHIEQIHADFSSLLEIFSPFSLKDFPKIYRNALASIPSNLKPLTHCAIHSCGMTSVSGIFKAVQNTLGTTPCVLYGENTYFECIKIANRISHASSIEKATEEEWKEVDLILAQFNPALKRIDLLAVEYKVEQIAEVLHHALRERKEKPLTLALDCTIDFIDSPRVNALLQEFQQEIEKGLLNVICYRSGLKFDLFGMDNYCGAPLYMIHNQDEKWRAFDFFLTDPALQTDRLSLNWFCLAYQSAAPYLEQYRKQIFDNTRSLLDKVPERLFQPNSTYRIVPFRQGADAAFVDVKVSGPLHRMKGSALAGGCLYMKCMEGGQPIFYRPSLGFYHPNFTMIFGDTNATIRLTLGLDPAQIDVLAETFKMIDVLNGPSQPFALEKLFHQLSVPSLSCLKKVQSSL